MLERAADLVADREDLLATRKLLMAFVSTLQSVFGFYCRLGECAHATGERFTESSHPPHATELLEPSAHRWVTAATGRLLGEGAVRPGGAAVVGRPPEAMTLRQFRQCCVDCGLVGKRCRMADVGRLWALACRPNVGLDQAAAAKVASAGGGQPTDVHSLQRRGSVYAFVEASLRVGNAVMDADTQYAEGGGGERTLAAQFEGLLSTHLLTYSCSHELVTEQQWLFAQPLAQAVVRSYRAQIEYIYMQLVKPKAAVERSRRRASVTTLLPTAAVEGADTNKPLPTGKSGRLYEQYRASAMESDYTLQFSVFYDFFESTRMLNGALPPRRMATIWESVTNHKMIQTSQQKALLHCVATAPEFAVTR